MSKYDKGIMSVSFKDLASRREDMLPVFADGGLGSRLCKNAKNGDSINYFATIVAAQD